MPVTYVIEFCVRPERRSHFKELLRGVLEAMSEESMFLDARLSVDPEDPDRFLLHETWQDHDDVLAVQLRRSYRDLWHAELPDLLAEERRIGIWNPIWPGP